MTEFNPGGAASLNEAVKLRYEANADTNAFTDAEKTKLVGVAEGANAYQHPDHSGDVISSGDGVTTISDGAVTYTKIQDVSAPALLLGRGNAGPGEVQEITLGAGLAMTGTELSASGGGGVSDAPQDGWEYVRSDGVWHRKQRVFKKLVDETRTNTNVFAPDSDIAGIAVEANRVYTFRFVLQHNAHTSTDSKYTFSFDSGLTGARMRFAFGWATSAVADRQDYTTGATGRGATAFATGFGTLLTAAEAGSFSLQWAQITAGSGATTLEAGSHLILEDLGAAS